jgi:hypothetical protein
VISVAPHHPKALAIVGTRKPLISKPVRTAVCLIENTSGARRGGETRSSGIVSVTCGEQESPRPDERSRGRSEKGAPAASNGTPKVLPGAARGRRDPGNGSYRCDCDGCSVKIASTVPSHGLYGPKPISAGERRSGQDAHARLGRFKTPGAGIVH